MIRIQPYYRVSRIDLRRGISIDLQDSVCRQFVASQIRDDHLVREPLVDRGKSAYTEDWTKRPAFLEMMEAAKRGEFDMVLVYMFDRFSRKTMLSLQAMQALIDADVAFRSATEMIDYNTPYGRKNVRDLASSAEFYSDLLSHRMKDVRAWEARQGRHVGPIPTGFRRESGVLIPIESIAAVQLAFALYATRVESYTTVADALNNAGYRTNGGQGFSKFQVAEMLSNPVYIGRVRCKDQEYPGQHAPAIDQSLWDTVQREIQRRVRGAGLRQPSSPALLSGLARCSNCGEPMWYTPGRGGHYNYYACRGRAQGGREPRCNLGMVRAEMVEGHVRASLITLVSDQTILSAVADELAVLARREQPARPVIDRTRIESRLKRIGQLYADDVMSEEEYQRERDRLKAQLQEQAPALLHVPQLRSVMYMLGQLPQLVEGASIAAQRALLTEVFDVIYVAPHHAMAARPASDYAAILQGSRLKIMGRWAGWAPSFYPLNFNPQIPPMLIAA